MARVLLMLLAALLVVGQARAQTEVRIVAAEASSFIDWQCVPENAYDGIADGTNGTSWQTAGNSKYQAGKDDSPWIAFRLEGDDPWNIGELKVWNFQEPAGHNPRGIYEVRILVSTDTGPDLKDYNFTPLPGLDPVNAPGVYRFDPAGPAYDASFIPVAQTICFDAVAVTAVKFEILSNWYWGWYGYESANFALENTPIEEAWAFVSYVGLCEVKFFQVPEPATMSLLALGGLALLRRRK